MIIEILEDFPTRILDTTKEFYVKKEGAEYVTVTNFMDYYMWQMFPFFKFVKPFVALSTFKIALNTIPTMLDKHKSNMAQTEHGGMPTISYDDIVD